MSGNALTTHVQVFSASDVKMMAQAIAKSGLFGIKDENQSFALMLIAQAEGRHPATVAQEYDIIQGRPALKSMAALARFQSAGGRIQWLVRSDTEARAKFVHELGGEVEIYWDLKRATVAGLLGKETWKKYPAQMLAARVVAEGVRACLPACLNGLYISEEVADFEAKGNPSQKQQEPTPRTAPTETDHIELVTKENLDILIHAARDEGLSDENISSLLGTEDWETSSVVQCKGLAEEIRKVRIIKNQPTAPEQT